MLRQRNDIRRMQQIPATGPFTGAATVKSPFRRPAGGPWQPGRAKAASHHGQCVTAQHQFPFILGFAVVFLNVELLMA